MGKLLYVFILFFAANSLLANSIDENDIPIVAWHGVPNTESTNYRFKELSNAGFTYSYTNYPSLDATLAALDVANESNIKLLVYTPWLVDNTNVCVKTIMNHPAFGGYFFVDEPSATKFPYLRELKNTINLIDSTNLCYINLYPIYASPKQLGTSDYETYVQNYISIVKPTMLSFDFYPIISGSDGKLSLRKDWFNNLEIISNQAKINKIPFWAFILATEHNIYPRPTMGQLRLQAFVNLAYGAQGIQYFTYWTPSGNSPEKFRNGPIDYEGNKTSTYYLIQELNKQIRDLSFVFLNSEFLSTKHIDKSETDFFGKNKSLSSRFSRIETNENDVFLSYLKNENRNYLVIVNKNFQEKISISIDTKVSSLKQIRTSSSSIKINKGSNKFMIEAGNILIISWNE